MFVHPSPDEMLEAVQVSLMNDILPECASPKAQVAVVMMQAILQTARQLIPVMQQNMVEEHNAMIGLYQEMANSLGESAGPEADRVRERAEKYGSRQELPTPATYETITAAHEELTAGLVDTMRDLDVLIREGNTAAEESLGKFRAMMGPRIARDFGTLVVGAGMAGRG